MSRCSSRESVPAVRARLPAAALPARSPCLQSCPSCARADTPARSADGSRAATRATSDKTSATFAGAVRSGWAATFFSTTLPSAGGRTGVRVFHLRDFGVHHEADSTRLALHALGEAVHVHHRALVDAANDQLLLIPRFKLEIHEAPRCADNPRRGRNLCPKRRWREVP